MYVNNSQADLLTDWSSLNLTSVNWRALLASKTLSNHPGLVDLTSLQHNHSIALQRHVDNTRRQLQLLLQSYYASDTTLEILLYSTLFVLGALGNLFLLAQLLGWKQRKSRANLLFLHLTLADLLVVIIIIPKVS